MKKVSLCTPDLYATFVKLQKRLLLRNNLEFKEIDISSKEGLMDEMIKKANGKRTHSQIFFDEDHIGGYQELRALEKDNKLKDKLKNNYLIVTVTSGSAAYNPLAAPDWLQLEVIFPIAPTALVVPKATSTLGMFPNHSKCTC